MMGQDLSKHAGIPGTLQPFEKPAGVSELWELGLAKNHELLNTALQPFGPHIFHVTDEATERHLAEICDLFEKSRDENARNALHHAMYSLNPDAACKLLALGMNPSSVDCAGRTPAHWLVMKRTQPALENQTSQISIQDLVKVLWLCRPALSAADWEKETVHSYALARLKVGGHSKHEMAFHNIGCYDITNYSCFSIMRQLHKPANIC
jgi:ankyrin repeat protein